MKIEAPATCPSCNCLLMWKNDLLYCTNAECESRAFKRIQHFAQTLKIKGLGPSAIEKLKLESIEDIYSLSFDIVAEAMGSEKLASKLMDEIEKSKSVDLEQLLPAFSIPLIGKTAATKLCAVIQNIQDINLEVCEEAGLGPKATENLLTWYNETCLSYLPFSFQTKGSKKATKGIVCITGKLKSFKTKAEAEKILLELGYSVKSSITKEVTILVNESGVESSKTKKARDSGVSIITNLFDLIGNDNDETKMD